MTERSVPARGATALREAKRAFAVDDYPLALARAAHAVALNQLVPEVLDLFGLLLDAAEPAVVADLLGDLLDSGWGDWPPAFHAGLAARRFDALSTLPAVDPGTVAEAALETLEAAAAGDAAAWRPVADPDRRAALLAAVDQPENTLRALEQLAYAPPQAGLRAHAAALAESFGFAHLAEPEVTRAAERVLYALGEADAARRVESGRKAARPRSASPRPTAAAPDLSAVSLVVAGGHGRLRAAVREDLATLRLSGLREIPPAWEGHRGTPPRDLVRGADLVLLVVRQLDHSTGDAVLAAADAEGVPAVRVRSASVAAIRSAITAAFAGNRDR